MALLCVVASVSGKQVSFVVNGVLDNVLIVKRQGIVFVLVDIGCMVCNLWLIMKTYWVLS